MAENKEILEKSIEVSQQPETLVDVRPREEKIPKEIETWMERIERDPQAKTINDPMSQNLTAATPSDQPKIVLPVTRKKFVAGFKDKVSEASRWLSAFILKLIKIKKGGVEFKKEG